MNRDAAEAVQIGNSDLLTLGEKREMIPALVQY